MVSAKMHRRQLFLSLLSLRLYGALAQGPTILPATVTESDDSNIDGDTLPTVIVDTSSNTDVGTITYNPTLTLTDDIPSSTITSPPEACDTCVFFQNFHDYSWPEFYTVSANETDLLDSSIGGSETRPYTIEYVTELPTTVISYNPTSILTFTCCEPFSIVGLGFRYELSDPTGPWETCTPTTTYDFESTHVVVSGTVNLDEYISEHVPTHTCAPQGVRPVTTAVTKTIVAQLIPEKTDIVVEPGRPGGGSQGPDISDVVVQTRQPPVRQTQPPVVGRPSDNGGNNGGSNDNNGGSSGSGERPGSDGDSGNESSPPTTSNNNNGGSSSGSGSDSASNSNDGESDSSSVSGNSGSSSGGNDSSDTSGSGDDSTDNSGSGSRPAGQGGGDEESSESIPQPPNAPEPTFQPAFNIGGPGLPLVSSAAPASAVAPGSAETTSPPALNKGPDDRGDPAGSEAGHATKVAETELFDDDNAGFAPAPTAIMWNDDEGDTDAIGGVSDNTAPPGNIPLDITNSISNGADPMITTTRLLPSNVPDAQAPGADAPGFIGFPEEEGGFRTLSTVSDGVVMAVGTITYTYTGTATGAAPAPTDSLSFESSASGSRVGLTGIWRAVGCALACGVVVGFAV